MTEIETYIAQHTHAAMIVIVALTALLIMEIVLQRFTVRDLHAADARYASQLYDYVQEQQNDRVAHEIAISHLAEVHAAQITAARRELSGYRSAVEHLTAHPTTVITGDAHVHSFPTGRRDEQVDAMAAAVTKNFRAAARNGDEAQL